MLNDKIQILQNKIDEKRLNKKNDHLNYYQRELSYSDLEKCKFYFYNLSEYSGSIFFFKVLLHYLFRNNKIIILLNNN